LDTTTTTTVKRTAFFNFGFAGSARTLKTSFALLLSVSAENTRTLLEEKEEEEEEALLVDAADDDDTELNILLFLLLLRVKKKTRVRVFAVKFLYRKVNFLDTKF